MADTTPERLAEIRAWLEPDSVDPEHDFEEVAIANVRDLLALVDQQAAELAKMTDGWRTAFDIGIANQERIQSLERELAEAKARVEAAIPQADIEMIAQVTTKAVYTERNRLVAALARLFPSGVARTSIPGWDITWEQCVYVDLPTGQVSWHFHDSEAYLFEGLPPYAKPWDGHSTEEKYNRLAALTTPPAGKD